MARHLRRAASRLAPVNTRLRVCAGGLRVRRPLRRDFSRHLLASHLTPLALILALAFVGALCALALTPGSASAAASRPQEAAITGTVVNGTHGDAAVPNLKVTLQSLGGNGTTDLATVTTDSAGHFAFAHLADADGLVYAVYTRYQQALFTTGSITVQGGTQNVQLLVYDLTGSDAALHITSITALVRDPRPVNGLVGVGEFFTFHNSGDTAYLGSTQAGNGLPMNLLRFALPTGATNVTLGTGFDGAQSATVGTGFGATATVPPGDSQFAFAFDLPYTGTSALLTIKAEYPADSALLLVPPPYTAQPQGMQARGQISTNGTAYSAFTDGALAAGTQVAARLSGLPPAGESPALNFGQLVALVGALALLLAALIAIYIRRGRLPFALGASNAGMPRGGAGVKPVQPQESDVEREQLLRELLTLQQARSRGELSAAQFRRRASDVRAALRALIASEMAPAQVAAEVAAEVAAKTTTPATHDGMVEEAASTDTGAFEAHERQVSAEPEASDVPASHATTGGSR